MFKSNKNEQGRLKKTFLFSLKIGLIGFILAIPLIANQGRVAGAPSTTLNFQARLLGSSGALVPDGDYHIEFKLYNVDSGGSALWTETRSTGDLVQVKNGYFTVNLGSVDSFPGTIEWSESHWLTMNVGGAGGSPDWDGEMTPRIKLTAVPLAFEANQLAKSSGSDRGTLAFGSVTNDPDILLPNASGEVCLDSGNCGFGTGDIVNGGQNGPITVGTNNNTSFFLETNNANRIEIQGDGDVAFNSTTLFVDATNNRIGIGDDTPSHTLDVAGDARITGTLGVGVAPSAVTGVSVGKTFSGGTSCGFGCYGVFSDVTASTLTGTSALTGLYAKTSTAAASFTLTNAYGVYVEEGTKGAGSTITNNYGIYVNTQTKGDNNYGLYINGASGGSGANHSLYVNSGSTHLGGDLNVTGTVTLTNDLSVANGGTGASTFASNGVLYGNGSGAIQATTAGTSGQVLLANGSGVPTFTSFSGDVTVNGTGVTAIGANTVALTTDTTGDYMANLGALTGLSTTGNSGEGSTPTLSVIYGSGANTAVQGNVTLTCPSGTDEATGGGNTITLGTGGTCSAIDIVENPTFDTSVTTPTLAGVTTLTLTSTGSSNDITLNSADTIELLDNTNVTGDLAVTGNTSLGNGASDSVTIVGGTGADRLVIQSVSDSNFGEIHGSTDNEFSISSDGTMYIVPNRDDDANGTNEVIFWDPATPSQDAVVINAANGNITSVGDITAEGSLVVTDSGSPVFVVGTGGVVTLGLGSADNNTVLCRNSSNQIATCSSTFVTSATAFIQGGNDFGGNAVLGTNGAGQTLSFETAGTTRLTIDTNGDASLTGNLTVQGTGTSGIAGNLAVDTNTLYVDATNNRVGIGTTTPNAKLHVLGEASASGTGTISTAQTYSPAVTGSGTSFTTQLAVGDTITASGQTRTITAIGGTTALTVNAPFNPVLTNASFTYRKPNIRLTDSSGSNGIGLTNTGVDGNFDINGAIGVGNNASAGGVAVMTFNHIFDNSVNCGFGCYGALFDVTAMNPAGPTGVAAISAQARTGAATFTLGSASGMAVQSAVLGAGSTITNNYGIQIANQTVGTNDYGLYIGGADTAALKVVRGETAADVLTVESVVAGNVGNNSGAEDNDPTSDFTNAWTAFGTSTIGRDTDAADIVSGVASVSAILGTTDENGVRNNLASNPALSTTYIVSFVARLTAGTAFTDMAVRYTPDGGTTNIDCTNYTTQTLTSGFVKVTCTILTTGASVSNPDLIIRQPTPPGSGRTIHIDNFSMVPQTASSTAATLRIGSSTGQGLQLLTLDHAAARPWTGSSNTLYGSMYYDTSLGKIQCYEADGWGACGGAPDNIVNLVPEYAGSVLNGEDVGTMTADLCSGTSFLSINTSLCGASESRNYYKWTSPQPTEQTYSIYISYQLPSTFNGFADANTIKLTGRTSSVTGNDGVTFALFQANGTQCGSTTEVNPTNINTWETTNLTGDETGCSFSPNDVITFRINMTATSGSSAYASNFSFTTLGK